MTIRPEEKPECPSCGSTHYQWDLKECPHCYALKCDICDMGDDVGCATCENEED